MSGRDSNGSVSHATGVPVVGGTTISSTVMNAELEMLRAEVEDSLSRSGKGGMTAPFRVADGTVTAPSLAFTQETGSGLYRAGAGDVGLARLGTKVFATLAGGVGALFWGTLTATSAIVKGAIADGASAIGVILDNSVSLVNAGAKLLSIRNNGSEKLYVDVDGGVHVAAGAGQVYATGFRSLEDLQATIVGSPVDGASAVGAAIDTESTLANATAKLLSVRNGGSEKLYVDKDGVLGSKTNLPAVGQQISTSSGLFSTASATYVDVTNLSATIATVGRPVHLALVPDGSGNVMNFAVPTGSVSAVALLRGATVLAEWRASNTSAGILAYPLPAQFTDVPAAGTYTYKVQMKTDAGGAQRLDYAKLVAFEL
jgi:hypothetical protein